MSEDEDWEYYESPSAQLFESLSELTEYTVTEDHLKLLRRAYADAWYPGEGDDGAAGISRKKPYGNSYIERDVAEIVGAPDDDWVFENGYKSHLTEEAEKRYLRLHIEAMAALQIVLAVGEFRPGRYQRAAIWVNNWRRVEDSQ